MARNAVIGALRVNLGLDSAAFDKGLKDAGDKSARFNKQLRAGMLAVAAAASAAAAGLAVAVRGNLTHADAMGKAAQATGVAVDELSRLRHAAEMSGATFGDLQTGLRRLSQTMAEAIDNPSSKSAEALRKLGVSATDADGRLRSSSDVMSDVAGAFAGMEDGAQKTSLAMDIFGRSGTSLVPMLNAGKDGLQAMKDEADQLGIVITEKTFRAAELFNDSLSRIQAVGAGFVTQITARLAPALAGVADRMAQAAMDGALMREAVDMLAVGLKAVATVAIGSAAGIMQMIRTIATLYEVAVQVISLDFTAAGEEIRAGLARLNAMRVEATEMIERLWSEEAQGAAAAEAPVRQYAAALAALPAAATTATASLAKVTESLRFQIAQIGRSSEEQAVYNALRSAGVSLDSAAGKEIAALAREYHGLAEAQRTAGEAQESRFEIQREGHALDAQDTHFLGSFVLAGEQVEAQMAAAKTETRDFTQAATDLGFAFESSFEAAVSEGGKLSDVLKGLARDLAKIALRETVTKPLGGLLQSGIGLLTSGLSGFFGGGSGFNAAALGAPTTFSTAPSLNGIGSAFGGFRADGGPMSAGKAYMVGERGPEMVVPRSRSMVVPNDKLGGGGQPVSVAFNIDARGAEAGVEDRVRQVIRNEGPGMIRMMFNSGRMQGIPV